MNSHNQVMTSEWKISSFEQTQQWCPPSPTHTDLIERERERELLGEKTTRHSFAQLFDSFYMRSISLLN